MPDEAAGMTGRTRGRVVAGEPLADMAAWTGKELEESTAWRYAATGEELDHLVAMARQVAAGLDGDPNKLLTMRAGAFDLGPFGERVRDEILPQVRDGLGVALYRGLPMDDLTLLEAAVIYWGMGQHIGVAQSNNPEGDMIGHVLDTGKDYNDPKHRGYQTRATMDYHCDQTDLVCLLCINEAKSGGLSKVTSSYAAYNELLRRRPDLVEVMRQPYCWTKHAETNSGDDPYYESPVFNFTDGTLSISFGPQHIMKGHALDEAPDITPAQLEGIQVMEGIAEEIHGQMELKRGDIQFVNNYTLLHTRTAFEDWPEPERKRTLWRLWLNLDDFLPRTPYSRQWAQGVSIDGAGQRIELVYPG